jgi:hypothetical protein
MDGSDVPPWRTMIFFGGQFVGVDWDGVFAAFGDVPEDPGKSLGAAGPEAAVALQSAETVFFLRACADAFAGADTGLAALESDEDAGVVDGVLV